MATQQIHVKPNMPIGEAIGLIVLYLFGLKIFAYIVHSLDLEAGLYDPILLRTPLYLVFALFFIYRARQYDPNFMGWQKPILGWWWRILPIWGQSVVGMILIVVSFLVCIFVLKNPKPIGEILSYLPFFIAVGINEELLFRSFLMGSTRPKIGWFWAAILSGVVFGLIHIQNSTSWVDFQNVMLWQSIQNIGPGLMYATAFYICRSIFPLIMIHTVWDFGLYTFQTMGKYMTEKSILTSIAASKSSTIDMLTHGTEPFGNMAGSLKSIGFYIAICLVMLGLNFIGNKKP